MKVTIEQAELLGAQISNRVDVSCEDRGRIVRVQCFVDEVAWLLDHTFPPIGQFLHKAHPEEHCPLCRLANSLDDFGH